MVAGTADDLPLESDRDWVHDVATFAGNAHMGGGSATIAQPKWLQPSDTGRHDTTLGVAEIPCLTDETAHADTS